MLTDEQKAQRKGKVTSSVAAGCLGLCPFMSPLQAWREIQGLRTFEGNKATERGTELEEVVLAWGAKEVAMYPTIAPFIASGWRGDSSDGLLYVDSQTTMPSAVQEGKTVGMGMAPMWSKESTNRVPDHVRVQGMWHLLHWPTAEVCYVPALFGGHAFEFRLYSVERDDVKIGRLEALLYKWWQEHIETLCAPEANHLDEGELRDMFPRDDSTMLADDPSVALHAIEYLKARDEESVAKKKKDQHGNRLRQLLGEHSGCCGDWGSVQYKANTNGTRMLKVKEAR